LSHHRAICTIEGGKFKNEVLPISIPRKKQEPLLFDTDEHPRAGLGMEQLFRLPAAFTDEGTVTAGNSCSMSDGAPAVIVTSRKKAEELKIKPLSTIKAYHVAGVDPNIMGIGPVPAIRTALKKVKMSLEDIDRYEINEAFAAQYLACERELGLDREKVNVLGSGIALGHPVGATGCRLVVTLLHGMINDDLSSGIASLCAGGGMGFAMIFERP